MSEKKKEKYRVLIVDDDLSSAHAIERVLRRGGFETEIAMDGFSARALLQSFAPAVMTLDLMMPGIDGMGALNLMGESDLVGATPILVISGMSEDSLRQALLQGAHDVLAKPYENEFLLQKVSRLARGEHT